eukprot:gene30737-39597_t
MDEDKRRKLLMDAQADALKQKEEEAKRLTDQAKRLDYITRALRIEAAEVFVKRYNELVAAEQAEHDKQESVLLEKAKEDHAKALQEKKRLSRMVPHRESVEGMVAAAQRVLYDQKVAEMYKNAAEEYRIRKVTRARLKKVEYEERLEEDMELERERQFREEQDKLLAAEQERLRRLREEEEEAERLRHAEIERLRKERMEQLREEQRLAELIGRPTPAPEAVPFEKGKEASPAAAEAPWIRQGGSRREEVPPAMSRTPAGVREQRTETNESSWRRGAPPAPTVSVPQRAAASTPVGEGDRWTRKGGAGNDTEESSRAAGPWRSSAASGGGGTSVGGEAADPN